MQHTASISFLYHSVFCSLLNPVMPSYSYQSCSLKQFQFPTHVAICFLTVLSLCVKSILILKPSQAAVLDSTCWMRVLFQTGKIEQLDGWNNRRKAVKSRWSHTFSVMVTKTLNLSEWKTDLLSKIRARIPFLQGFLLLDCEKGHVLYLWCAWLN